MNQLLIVLSLLAFAFSIEVIPMLFEELVQHNEPRGVILHRGDQAAVDRAKAIIEAGEVEWPLYDVNLNLSDPTTPIPDYGGAAFFVQYFANENPEPISMPFDPEHYEAAETAFLTLLEAAAADPDLSLIKQWPGMAQMHRDYTQTHQPYMVMFGKRGNKCSHCNIMRSAFARFLARYDGLRLFIAEENCGDPNNLECAGFKVTKYPTVWFYHGLFLPYEGEPSVSAISAFASQYVQLPPFEWPEGIEFPMSPYHQDELEELLIKMEQRAKADIEEKVKAKEQVEEEL